MLIVTSRNALELLEISKVQQSAPLAPIEPLYPRTPVTAIENDGDQRPTMQLQRAATDTEVGTTTKTVVVTELLPPPRLSTEIPVLKAMAITDSTSVAEMAPAQSSTSSTTASPAPSTSSASRWRRPDLSIQLFKEDEGTRDGTSSSSFPARTDSLRRTATRQTNNSASRAAAAAAVAAAAAKLETATKSEGPDTVAPHTLIPVALPTSTGITRERTIINTDVNEATAAPSASEGEEIAAEKRTPQVSGLESVRQGERGSSAISLAGSGVQARGEGAGAAMVERRPTTFLRSGMKRLLSTGSTTATAANTAANTATITSPAASANTTPSTSIWRRLGSGSEKRSLFRSGSEQRAHEQTLVDKTADGVAVAAAAAAAAGISAEPKGSGRRRTQQHARRRSTVAFKGL